MTSIKFDNVELVSSTYNVSKVLDNTTPERSLTLIETEGVDGAVIVSDRFGSKTIEIKGILIGSSEADLQSKIDTANELFSRKGVNLDVLPSGGSTRRYVVRLIGSVEYDREYYHIDYVPFRLKLFVYDGVGKDTSETTALSKLNTTLERDPASGSDTINFAGSADPKPEISFTLDTIGKLDLITIHDDDSGEEMSIEIDGDYSASDEVVVNLENETVQRNGEDVPSLGKFPSFLKGDNDIHITYQGATYVLDQEGDASSSSTEQLIGDDGAGSTQAGAQSFVPSQSGYLSRIQLWIKKTNTPSTVLQVRVYSDNGGKPYENLVSGASGFTIAPADVSTSKTLETLDDPTPDYYLRKGVRYWLVFSTASSGGYYRVSGSLNTASPLYANGEALIYDGGKLPPTDPNDWLADVNFPDFGFKTYLGQGGSANWVVDYVISYVKRYL